MRLPVAACLVACLAALPPAHAAPTRTYAGLGCGFVMTANPMVTNPPQQLTAYVAGPIVVPEAATVTITCEFRLGPTTTSTVADRVTSTTPGIAGALVAENGTNIVFANDPVYLCTTLSWTYDSLVVPAPPIADSADLGCVKASRVHGGWVVAPGPVTNV